MWVKLRWWFALWALGLSGCVVLPIPQNQRMTPLYHGIILDADDGRPVPGVLVKAESRVWETETQEGFEALMHADEKGYYEVAAMRHTNWFFAQLAGTTDICSGKLTFTHPRYETVIYRSEEVITVNTHGVCVGVKIEKNVKLNKRKSD